MITTGPKAVGATCAHHGMTIPPIRSDTKPLSYKGRREERPGTVHQCSVLWSLLYVSIAQTVEHAPVKRVVVGSNPS